MVHKVRKGLILAVSCFIFLAGCGDKKERQTVEIPETQLAQIDCIAVLPAVPLVREQAGTPEDPEMQESLVRGTGVMNTILSQELGGKNNIRFVSGEHVASMQLSGGESFLELARKIGRDMNCNAVLENQVLGFKERDGGRYSVESPAAVAFKMRLVDLDSGSVLWSAWYDEVQKSVMENLLELGKANKRGFVWITAEELMREGIRSKLDDSPYFTIDQETR